MPAEKNAEAMMGTIQCTLAPLVQPNQNIEMGSSTAPTIAIGRRSSGTNSACAPSDMMSLLYKDSTYLR